MAHSKMHPYTHPLFSKHNIQGINGKKRTSMRAMLVYIGIVAWVKFDSVLSQKWGLLQFCAFIIIFCIIWLFMALMVLFCTCMAPYGTFLYFWPVTLFCGEFLFLAIYALFRVKLFWHKPCVTLFFFVFFHVCTRGVVNRLQKRRYPTGHNYIFFYVQNIVWSSVKLARFKVVSIM